MADFGDLTFATRERIAFDTAGTAADLGDLTWATRERWVEEATAAPGGLSIPVAMDYYRRMRSG